MLDLENVRTAWQLPPISASWSPGSGTVHQTVLFATNDGRRYALRLYRYIAEDRARIEQEHMLSTFVRVRGLPAVTPLPLAHGETILERAGRFSALFPFAEGYQTRRERYAPDEISAMGRCLGELHQVLSLYPTPQERPDLLKIDQAAILTKLNEIEQAIAARPQSEERSRVLSLLVQRRAWLLSAEQPASDAFLQLETQLIHGDYQETNLFFQHGKVSAIIDWDQSYVAPRAWEVLRTLHYAGQLDADFCRIFLAAYRQVLPLALDELDIAVEIYSWLQAHNLWIYEELYLRGNTRVQALQEPHAQFVPFATRWTNLRQFVVNA